MKTETKTWLEQADRDIRTAKNCLESEDYYASAYFSHQATEKALKSMYIEHEKKFLKIHDLVKLAREIKASEDIIEKCAKINPTYTEVRYPESDELPADKVNKKEAEEIIKLAKEVLEWTKEKLSLKK